MVVHYEGQTISKELAAAKTQEKISKILGLARNEISNIIRLGDDKFPLALAAVLYEFFSFSTDRKICEFVYVARLKCLEALKDSFDKESECADADIAD